MKPAFKTTTVEHALEIGPRRFVEEYLFPAMRRRKPKFQGAFVAVLLLFQTSCGGTLFHKDFKNINGISVEAVPADVPEFRRIYSATINQRAGIKITAETFFNRRFDGELIQPDGRWVDFDPNAIAEKILDRELVPLVQSYVDKIKSLDRSYMDSNPSEFIDAHGVKWRRDKP